MRLKMGRNLGKGVLKLLFDSSASSSSGLRGSGFSKTSFSLVSRIAVKGSGNFSSECRGQQHRTYSTSLAADMKILKQRQLEIETRAWAQKEKFYKEVLEDSSKQKLVLPHVKSTFMEWFKPLRDAIQADIDTKSRRGFLPNYAPYMRQLSPDRMCIITMHQLMLLLIDEAVGVGIVNAQQASSQIGQAIEREAFLRKEQKVTELSPELREDINIKIGARLIDLLIKTATVQPPIDELGNAPPARPAFKHTTKKLVIDDKVPKWKSGVIECDPLVGENLEKIGEHIVVTDMPMLTPPRKWTRYNQGGYLFLPSYAVKTRGLNQHHAIKQAPNKQLTPIFEALNMLGSTKWRINKKVLRIVDSIRATGGRMPFPVEHLRKLDIAGLELEVAHRMKEEEGFYFPHNIDFRGRAYPLHPHLNHQGSDLCRGLLEFSGGKPLGKSGLRWLKIHLASLFGNGVDKKSYEARVEFTDSHIKDIHDSAKDPLGGKKWWLDAEKPYQCLAVCINLSDALENPFPETTISHIPVHQDGSCNGLQHYAALGRDMLGAIAVNLVRNEEPAEKPADVYSQIASKVCEIMRQDAEQDPKRYGYATILINEVDRELVKQTVMTSVYGLTYYGARVQIEKKIKERRVFEDEDLCTASSYATEIIWRAIWEFQGAKSIKTWFGDCAKIIAKENKPISWTTPLGLPVVQPYHEFKIHQVVTPLQKFHINKETEKVKVKKQVSAFAPNFIHSLDGSHMMMTAVACNRAGLDFAEVHDSYWTHACDVDQMNKILREKFVELYNLPILENLLESFQKCVPDQSFPAVPDRGDYDIREVLRSLYFFN